MGEREICLQELDSRGLPDWVMQIGSEVENNKSLNTTERGVWKKHTIYKIPEDFIGDEKRKKAYKPQVVSMGPYHHGEQQLLPMEEHKRRALRHFLVRTQTSIIECRYALRRVMQELMDSYKDLEKKWKDNNEGFLQLMIIDGCFMIEVLRTAGASAQGGCSAKCGCSAQCDCSAQSKCGCSAQCDYDENDPIFSGHGVLSNMPRIKRDMLMIENQIPLLVLKKLFSVARVADDQCEQKQRSLNQEVKNMVLKFFAPETLSLTESSNPTNPKKSTTEPPSSTTTAMSKLESTEKVELGLHALDVVRMSMIKDIKGGRRDVTAPSNDVILSATQLHEAGIKFSKSGSTSLEDIRFSPGCLHTTLSLPQLVVDDATESKFLNIMAFEHLHVSSGNEVSSYVCFMDNIIDSEKDVSLLSRNSIIKNFVGTDQAVADIFNGISHDVSIDPASNLRKVHQDVTEYCNKPRNTYCAKLMHSHFDTPWSIIAFLAASVALIITIIQFGYSTFDFKEKL